MLDFETFAQYHTNSVNVELANGPLIVKIGGKEAYVEPWLACHPIGGPLSWELIRGQEALIITLGISCGRTVVMALMYALDIE